MVFYMYTCFTILHVHFFQNSSTMNMLDLIFLSYVVSRIFASAPPPSVQGQLFRSMKAVLCRNIKKYAKDLNPRRGGKANNATRENNCYNICTWVDTASCFCHAFGTCFLSCKWLCIMLVLYPHCSRISKRTCVSKKHLTLECVLVRVEVHLALAIHTNMYVSFIPSS